MLYMYDKLCLEFFRPESTLKDIVLLRLVSKHLRVIWIREDLLFCSFDLLL